MKTNYTILIILFITIFSSCKKTYKCSCTTTLSQPGYYPYQTVSLQIIDKKTTKKRATEICKNTTKQMQANTRLVFEDDEDITISTTCAIVL